MDDEWVHSLIQKSVEEWRFPVIERFLQEQLLQWKDNKLALTEDGILIAYTVISALLMRDVAITDTSGK